MVSNMESQKPLSSILFSLYFVRSNSKDVFVQARSAADRWEVAHSAFLTPPVLKDALMAVRKLSDVGALVSGGYAQVPSVFSNFGCSSYSGSFQNLTSLWPTFRL